MKMDVEEWVVLTSSILLLDNSAEFLGSMFSCVGLREMNS